MLTSATRTKKHPDFPPWNGRGDIPAALPFEKTFLLQNNILPVVYHKKSFFVIAAPQDAGLIQMLQKLHPDSRVLTGDRHDLQHRLETHFGQTSAAPKSVANDDTPVIQLVEKMIHKGIQLNASDIHLEPLKDKVVLRYRVDGVLHQQPAPTKDMLPAIISRIKILSGLDIAERRRAQDGRFSFAHQKQAIDIRVSTLPSSQGEDINLRLLDHRQQLTTLSALGLSRHVVEGLKSALRRSHGLILVTGPTGSGKTTTLYAGLRNLIDGSRKIITVEDPVEYEIDGITQIQVNDAIDRGFSGALRSILRHDPDVILIGEIRDKATAEIAIQASLTGHLVLSTIHTNSALGATTRLLNMGIPDYLISSALAAVSGQRLVRRLCKNCKTPQKINPAVAAHFGIPKTKNTFGPKGCKSCNHIGYQGRLPIAEFFPFTKKIKHIITQNPTPAQLLSAAQKGGYKTLQEDGLARALNGETSIEEILRVSA